MEDKEGFSYTYSAKKQDEVKEIRQKYIFEETDKRELLHRLDSGVTKKAMKTAVTSGIIGVLIMVMKRPLQVL